MSAIIYPVQKRYLESLRPPQDQLITEMEQFAEEKKIPIIDWKAADLLIQFIKIMRPKNVLEIGTAIGYSTILIARAMQENSMLYTLEKSSPNINLANYYITKASMSTKVEIIVGDALDTIPTLEQKFDIIFLDADKEDYKNLLELSIPKLNTGGLLFVDNLLWKGYIASPRAPKKFKNSTNSIKEFNQIFTNHPSLASSIYPVGDGVGVAIKLD